ncbi:unnamed protein product [marine sediment metagenome]|uniref:Uncharacterized protein n=1 Tax=marine sediment metagenome TaxID=412755 RepID=X1R4C9_9ZZZZ
MATLSKKITVDLNHDIKPEDLRATLQSFREQLSLELLDDILNKFTKNAKNLSPELNLILKKLLNKHLTRLE